MGSPQAESFKVCPCCGQVWRCRDAFLHDRSLQLNGYMADLKVLEKGLFYFTHLVAGCRSTLVVPAGRFLDLYAGALGDRGDCPVPCRDRGRLERCEAICEYAFARAVIRLILQMKNQPVDAFDFDMVSLPWLEALP